MNKLKALLNKGFMLLTRGKRIAILKSDEVIFTKGELSEIRRLRENEKSALIKEVCDLKIKCEGRYNKGFEAGIGHSLPILCNKPKNSGKKLGFITLIATELIEQDVDLNSCEWLYNKIHECRTL